MRIGRFKQIGVLTLSAVDAEFVGGGASRDPGVHREWPASGEAIIGLVRRPLRGPGLDRPPGVATLPGPSLVIAERVVESPVGPYITLGVARPARIGLRVGLCFTMMAVDIPGRLTAGRRRFGLPGERAALSWGVWGDESALVWEERGIEVRGWARGRWFPLAAPGRAVQRRGDGPVVVPLRVRGRARRARVEIVVPDGDPLGPLAGTHTGGVLSDLRIVLHRARRPLGRLASFPAPAPNTEPGWSVVRAPATGRSA